MTGRRNRAKQGNIAVIAAMLVLAAWITTPVFAAPDRDAHCDKNAEATLEIRVDSMSTTVEAVADDHLLKPRVEETARRVFADTTSETETEEAVEVESDDDETATTRLRPLSDNELVPFRRQMYRRDI